MKKISKLLMASLLLLATSCEHEGDESNSSSSSTSEDLVDESKDVLFNEHYENLVQLSDVEVISEDNLMYDTDEFGEFDGRKYQELYKNNVFNNQLKDGQITETDDAKYLFYNDNSVRFVNRSDGYAFNLKTSTTMNTDFSASIYRSKIYNAESTLTVSKETKNPYSKWSTYRDEWLIRYINNPKYLENNNMVYTEDVIFENNSILQDYVISIFSIEILDPGQIKKMFYNIGIVRPIASFTGKEFYLFVMKSNHQRNDDFKEMLKSFQIINSKGTSKNHIVDLVANEDENWNEQTKKYYDKLIHQQRTDWGIFTSCMEDERTVQTRLDEFSEAMDYQYDILPTYQHVLSNGRKIEFAKNSAIRLAGGDGFNNKMVLQFSYQFTNNNNSVTMANTTDNYTPMFDILRGPLEEYDFFNYRSKIYSGFDSLANGLIEYKAPVLFRLNNEMNTDWTSYCGLITLVDPDIFQATWRCLYLYLKEKGVQNTIWIFNPVADTTPFSSWGEDMAYFPGNEYVHALGLTAYRDNNSNDVNEDTFHKDYTKVYNKNIETWKNYPWIISEFGCGSGGNASGERYRNQESQANYVRGMFNDLKDREHNEYLQNIKGAVWFSCNDYANGKITNQYDLVIDKLPLTINEFKEGLKVNK